MSNKIFFKDPFYNFYLFKFIFNILSKVVSPLWCVMLLRDVKTYSKPGIRATMSFRTQSNNKIACGIPIQVICKYLGAISPTAHRPRYFWPWQRGTRSER